MHSKDFIATAGPDSPERGSDACCDQRQHAQDLPKCNPHKPTAAARATPTKKPSSHNPVDKIQENRTTVAISDQNCDVLCNPSMVKKNGNRCNFPLQQATQTQRLSLFSMVPTFFGPVQEGSCQGNIENEGQSCVCVARPVGFPFFSPQTVGGLASAGSVWPGDAHDGNGGPACASTEPFAAFDARAQCHKARSFSFSNK